MLASGDAAATARRMLAARPRWEALVGAATGAAAFVGSVALSRAGFGASEPGSRELDWIGGLLIACSTVPLVAWLRAHRVGERAARRPRLSDRTAPRADRRAVSARGESRRGGSLDATGHRSGRRAVPRDPRCDRLWAGRLSGGRAVPHGRRLCRRVVRG